MFRNARRIAALAVVVAALPAASASAANTYAGMTTVSSGSVSATTSTLGVAVAAEPKSVALLLPAVQKIREAAVRP